MTGAGRIPDQKFDFLGYTFRPRLSRRRRDTFGVSFSPAASDKALKAIRQTVRSWTLHERSDKTLDDLARMFNATSVAGSTTTAATTSRLSIRPYGTSTAFGTMGASEVQVPPTPPAANTALAGSHRATPTVAVRTLGAAAGARPNNGSRMRREPHVRFCERLAVKFRRATHLVILSRGHAEEALAWTRRVMTRLGLTLNEAKTSVRDARREGFDFLGYSFGPHHYRKDGHWYLGRARPRRACSGSRCKCRRTSGPRQHGALGEVRARLNRLLRGWSAYFGYGTAVEAYRAVGQPCL